MLGTSSPDQADFAAPSRLIEACARSRRPPWLLKLLVFGQTLTLAYSWTMIGP
jgi:hypothetical protein